MGETVRAQGCEVEVALVQRIPQGVRRPDFADPLCGEQQAVGVR
jgi:hypothetical protein